jgi:archaeal flagellar protein FlaJ
MNFLDYTRFCNNCVAIIKINKKNRDYTEKNLILEQAGLKIPYQDYRNVKIITTFLITCISLVFSFFLFSVFFSNLSIFFFTIIPIILSVLTFSIFQFLPLVNIGTRARNIDRFLPFAVNYINTMAKTNISPVEIFRSLSSTTTYGILKEETLKIVKEVELMGVDNVTALKHAIDRSPSKKFKGFLQGFIGTIQAGSNLTTYLSNMAEFYMKEDMRTREKNLESLSLVAELFVVAVIAFPIFLIIIVTVFGFIGDTSPAPFEILFLLSFIILPLCYFAFYYMIRTTLNEDFKCDSEKSLTLAQHYKKNKPFFKVVIITLLILLMFYIVTYAIFSFDYLPFNQFYWYDILFISILIIIGPLGMYSYVKSIKGKEMQERFPDFLVDIGNSLSSGMSIFDSIQVSSKANYGKLTPEVKKMKIDLSWQIPIKSIFTNLSLRLKNSIIDRTIITINKGLYMGGGDADIFKALSREIKQINQIDEQRNIHMTMYLMIIVISFMVFLFIMVILNSTLFSYFFEFQETQSQALEGFLISVDQIKLHYSLYCFTFVQSIGSGLLGGYMKDGAIFPGLRYSLALGLISIILFQIIL